MYTQFRSCDCGSNQKLKALADNTTLANCCGSENTRAYARLLPIDKRYVASALPPVVCERVRQLSSCLHANYRLADWRQNEAATAYARAERRGARRKRRDAHRIAATSANAADRLYTVAATA